MIATVDRTALSAAIEDIARLRDVLRERDYPTYVRLSANTEHGIYLDAVHLVNSMMCRREIRGEVSTANADETAVAYIDLDALIKLPFHDSRVGITFSEQPSKSLIMQCGETAITFTQVLRHDLSWEFPFYEIAPVDIIGGNRFAAMLKWAIVGAAKDDTRPILTALQYQFTANGISATTTLMGADGFRVHAVSFDVPGAENRKPFSMLLHADTMRRLLPVIENAGYVHISRHAPTNGGNLIHMSIGYLEVIFPETSGVFPHIDHLISTNAPLYLSADRQRLLNIAADMRKWHQTNGMAFSANDVRINGYRGELVIRHDYVPQNVKHSTRVSMPNITIKPAYLQDALRHMPLRKGGLVGIHLTDGNKPVTLTGGYFELSFTAVIMPMIIR